MYIFTQCTSTNTHAHLLTSVHVHKCDHGHRPYRVRLFLNRTKKITQVKTCRFFTKSVHTCNSISQGARKANIMNPYSQYFEGFLPWNIQWLPFVLQLCEIRATTYMFHFPPFLVSPFVPNRY